MRSLPEIIDQITAIAPDLAAILAPIRQSSIYAAPEVQHLFWRRAAETLTEHAADHPRAAELKAIFKGDVNNG